MSDEKGKVTSLQMVAHQRLEAKFKDMLHKAWAENAAIDAATPSKNIPSELAEVQNSSGRRARPNLRVISADKPDE